MTRELPRWLNYRLQQLKHRRKKEEMQICIWCKGDKADSPTARCIDCEKELCGGESS